MGVVWNAWDTELSRVVALKQVLSETDPDQVERFMREARAAARLRHPHIVAVHDVGCIDGQHYYTADLVEGGALDEAPLPLPPRRAADVAKTIAGALAYAHDQGILHRDVKPANILLDGKGEPFVMDFGLAKDLRGELGQSLTVSGQFLGTPAYMSPEQARGEASSLGPASDQFSLGAVLYELLTGRRAFEGLGLMATLEAVNEGEPERPSRVNPKVQRDLETVCLKALEKDPSRRYASMAAFSSDLGRWLAGEPISAHPASWPARVWRKTTRNWRVALPSAVATAVLLAVGTWAAVGSWRRAREVEAGLQRAQGLEDQGDSIADLAEGQKAYQQAREEVSRVLDRQKGNPEATRLFSLLGARLEQVRAAEETARTVRAFEKADGVDEVLARNPSYWQAHANKGLLFDAMGEPARAVECYERALALVGDNYPKVKERLARAREAAAQADLPAWARKLRDADAAVQRGDYAAARATYEDALAELAKDSSPRASEASRGAHYNLACIFSLASAGKDGPKAEAKPLSPDDASRLRERAFRELRAAIDLGYADAKHLAEDSDLVPLHKDPRWEDLLARFTK